MTKNETLTEDMLEQLQQAASQPETITPERLEQWADNPQAIEAFEAYTEDETYGAGAAYNIGICKMNLGDYAGAIEAFNTCEAKGKDAYD